MIKNFILINSDQQDVLKTAAFKIGFFKCLIIFLSIFGSIKVINWIRKLCHFIQKYHNKIMKKISLTRSLNTNNNNNNSKICSKSIQENKYLIEKKNKLCKCCANKFI